MDKNKYISNPIEISLKLSYAGSGKKIDSTFYGQILGSLMYLTAIRSDIIYGLADI